MLLQRLIGITIVKLLYIVFLYKILIKKLYFILKRKNTIHILH